MNRPAQEIEAYLHGNITPEQVRVLEVWIQAKPENAYAFLSAVRLHMQIGERLRQHQLRNVLDSTQLGISDRTETEIFDAEVLGALLALEQAAEAAEPVHPLSPESPFPQRGKKVDELTPSAIVSSLAYLGRELMVSKPALFAYAAVITLLAAGLALYWTGDETPKAPLITTDNGVTDDNTPRSTPQTATVVATITFEREAVWSREPGQSLQAGQQLTLTSGVAEITTNDGAVLLLEAPCTVQTIDHNNALRLVSGKLVGIVETDSAKGLLIRAPHIDVIDIGTRFGIDATSPTFTEVHVYEGAVDAKLPAGGRGVAGDTQRVLAGQAVAAVEGSDQLKPIPTDLARFNVLTPTLFELPGTGMGELSEGDRDVGWQITAIDGQRLDPPITPVVWWESGLSDVGSKPNDPQKSQWIGLTANTVSKPEATYVFQTRFTLPHTVAIDDLALALQIAADNQVVAIRVNGNEIGVPQRGLQDFVLKPMLIDNHLRKGENVIDFEIFNGAIATERSPVGLRIEWRAVQRRTDPVEPGRLNP